MKLAPYKPQISLNGVASAGNGSMIFPSSVMPTTIPRHSRAHKRLETPH
jgi:hypothetical protein